MSIFGNILGKIFPSHHPAVAGGAAPAPTAGAAPSAAPAGAPSAPAAAPAAMPAVDVEQILNQKAQQRSDKLNWRTSIVDLMKLLDLDSSLDARKSLARELGYGGDMNDSASLNMWLHKQVMRKLAENGGKVPAELKD